MRKIKFKLLTQSKLVSVETNARTFADLQTEIQQNPQLKDVVVFGKSQFIDNATKAQYGNIPDAVLPATDCLFYVVPTETKSGCDLPAVEEMSYMDLRSLGSKLNHENGASIDLTGKRSDILPRVVEFLEKEEEFKEEHKEDFPISVEDAIVAHAVKIIELVEEWKTTVVDQESKIAFKTTYDEVEAEAQRLKALLK
jgi:hypothetical protein